MLLSLPGGVLGSFALLKAMGLAVEILSGDHVANANGFFGLWLPAEIEGTIVVSHEGHEAVGAFATYATSPTCMTTLELS